MSDSARATRNLVERTLERDPAVRRALQRDLVNVRALARSIIDTSGTDASLAAVISAIRRYPLQKQTESRSVGEVIAKLSLRDGITAFGLENSEEIWAALSKLPAEVKVARGDTLRIISGVEATTVIVDSKNADRLRNSLPSRSIGRSFADLAEITVHLKEPSWETTGVLSALATELALNGVNIVYHFGYGPPPCIVFEVHEKDAVKAYHAFESLKKS
jgi:hypothetical protein